MSADLDAATAVRAALSPNGEPTPTAVTMYGQTVHVNVAADGRCQPDWSDDIVDAFNDPSWVADAVRFVVDLTHPTPDELFYDDKTIAMINLFHPDGHIHAAAAKILLKDGKAVVLQREIWEAIAEQGTPMFVDEFLCSHPDCPPDIRRSVALRFSNRTANKIAPYLDEGDLQAVIDRVNEFRWFRLPEPPLMLQHCRPNVAAQFTDPDRNKLWVRKAVAANEQLPPEVAMRLLDDPDESVVGIVLESHPRLNVPKSKVRELRDRAPFTREAINAQQRKARGLTPRRPADGTGRSRTR